MFAAIDLFMTYLKVEKNYSDHTIEAYNRDLLQFHTVLMQYNKSTEYCIDVRVDRHEVEVTSVSKKDIRAFVEYCFDREMAQKTIERKIATLKSFFKFLYNRDLVKDNPAYTVIFPKKEKKLPHFLYHQQVEEILDFPLETFLDYRDRAILEVFYATGARISEIAHAGLQHLSVQQKTLRVMGKGSVERIVFLTESSVAVLEAYFLERKKKFHALSGALFVNNKGRTLTSRGIFYIIKKRARAAGYVDYVSPHTFRHSFATELLNRGADIKAVQDLLGHAHISATQIYTHTTRKRLQAVYERCHPHAREKE
jgi:integrase/recombinase XerC